MSLDQTIDSLTSDFSIRDTISAIETSNEQLAETPTKGDLTPVSPVLYLRPIPATATELDLRNIFCFHGGVDQVVIQRTRGAAGQAFIQMNSLEDGIKAFQYYAENPLCLNGENVSVEYSKSQQVRTGRNELRRRESLNENNQSRILLITIQNPAQHVTTDSLFKVFSSFGRIQKIVIFAKTVGLQSLVQFEAVDNAVRARHALDGLSLFHDCCTLIINYSKLEDLVVKENSLRSRDYTQSDLPSPEIDTPIDPCNAGVSPMSSTHPTASFAPNDGGVNSTYESYMNGLLSGEDVATPVLLVCNLDEERVNCNTLFNLFSCYGMVIRIRKLLNKPDHALIQMSSHEAVLSAMTHLRGFRLFHRSLDIRLSKHHYVSRPPRDHSDSENIKEYTKLQNRFSSREKQTSTQGKYICSPTSTLYVSNLPENTSDEDLRGLVEGTKNKIMKMRIFKSNDLPQALLQFYNVDNATDCLCLLHHTNFNGKRIRVAFSRNALV